MFLVLQYYSLCTCTYTLEILGKVNQPQSLCSTPSKFTILSPYVTGHRLPVSLSSDQPRSAPGRAAAAEYEGP